MSNIIKRYKRSDDSVRIYHEEHDRLILRSRILNIGEIANIGTMFFTKENMEAELITLLGEKDGKYFRDHQTMTGQIPYLQEKLDELALRFEETNIEREMRGLRVFEDLPDGLMKEKLRLEAQLDVALSEKSYLEERITKGKTEEDQKRKDNILKYGLRQSVSMKNGLIDSIDGQRVEYVDGKPVIAEFIYFGMSVSEYRLLADIWLKEKRKVDQEAFNKLCEARKRNNLPIPTQQKVSSVKAIDKSTLPKFPEWAKRYLTV